MRILNSLLFVLVVAGLVAAGGVLARRHSAEERNRHVEVAIDASEVRALAASSGSDVASVFRAMRAAGATSVAVTEETVGDLLSTGQATMERVGSRYEMPLYRLQLTSPEARRAIEDALGGQDSGALEMDPAQIAGIPLGFALERDLMVWLAQDLGFRTIARAQSFSSPARTAALRSEIDNTGAHAVVFAGDQVPGWRGAEDQTARLFESGSPAFGAIEFGKQKGSEKIEALLKGRYLRVHSISTTEMATYQPAAAVERFVRAARERGIRILYIHLPFTAGAQAVARNADFLRDLSAGLRRSGLSGGDARMAGDPRPSAPELALMSAGVAAAGVLAVLTFIEMGLAASLAWLAALCAVLVSASLAGDMGRKVAALAAALIFPAWAVARAARLSEEDQTSNRSQGVALASHYVGAIAIAMFGGAFVAALLSGRTFMTATDQFAGVKLAHIFPVLVALAAAAAGVLGRPQPPRDILASAVAAARRIWNSPVLFGAAGVGLFAVVALMVVVLRSGNDAGVGVSPMELRFRALLDHILYVRPRTKEILIGHPALWAAIWLMMRRQPAWASVFFVAAALGLASVLNTFCHIHTPLALSFARVFNGAWVGAVGGLVLVWALAKLGLGRASAAA